MELHVWLGGDELGVRIEALRPTPGDLIVVTVPQGVATEGMVRRIDDLMEKLGLSGRVVVVLSHATGAIQVLSSDEHLARFGLRRL